MNRILALAAAACLIAVPASFAQTEPQPANPPAATQPATPPTTPEPAPPAAEPAATPAPQGEARCRTSKDVGEQCSCLSAPTEFGTSAQATNGSHNMCVVPQNGAASTPEQ